MDPITHLLSGASIQGASRGLGFRGGLDKKSSEHRALMMIIIVASILPDIDHLIFMPMGWEIYIKHHRGFTHSLIGAPFMALGAIYAVKGIYKLFKRDFDLPLKGIFIFPLFAVLIHILLDFVTSYGTMVFYPLSFNRYSLNLLFIIDGVATAIFALSFLVSLIFKNSGVFLSRFMFLFFFVYLIFNVGQGKYLTSALHEELNVKQGVERSEILSMRAYPAPWSPLKWITISETKDKFYLMRTEPGVKFVEVYEKEDGMEEILQKASIDNSMVETYLWFADYVLTETKVNEDGAKTIELFDLRFNTRPPAKPFVMTVEIGKDGKVASADFGH